MFVESASVGGSSKPFAYGLGMLVDIAIGIAAAAPRVLRVTMEEVKGADLSVKDALLAGESVVDAPAKLFLGELREGLAVVVVAEETLPPPEVIVVGPLEPAEVLRRLTDIVFLFKSAVLLAPVDPTAVDSSFFDDMELSRALYIEKVGMTVGTVDGVLVCARCAARAAAEANGIDFDDAEWVADDTDDADAATTGLDEVVKAAEAEEEDRRPPFSDDDGKDDDFLFSAAPPATEEDDERRKPPPPPPPPAVVAGCGATMRLRVTTGGGVDCGGETRCSNAGDDVIVGAALEEAREACGVGEKGETSAPLLLSIKTG